MQQQLDRKLHPRTGFLIVFPGLVFFALLILYSISTNLQAAKNVPQGYATLAAILIATVLFQLWMNRGHVVRWDEQGISIRQPDADFLLRRYPFAEVHYSEVRGIKLLPSPRGVPPKYPLIAIEAQSQKPLLIDPNYFKGASLAEFVAQLRTRVPELANPAESKVVDRLLKILTR